MSHRVILYDAVVYVKPFVVFPTTLSQVTAVSEAEKRVSELGQRMELAQIHLMSTMRRKVGFPELAELVTAEHGERRYTSGQISEYQKGDATPTLGTIAAYALACGVDPGWLAFGPLSKAASPKNLPEHLAHPVRRKRRQG